VIAIVLDKSRPNSHPRNPVAKQLRFIVADIHIYKFIQWVFDRWASKRVMKMMHMAQWHGSRIKKTPTPCLGLNGAFRRSTHQEHDGLVAP
jgi:hypothetical protein